MSEKTDNKIPNVPNLRFSGCTNNLERIRCSDFLTFYSTNSLSWDQLSYIEKNDIQNLHYGLIHNGAPTLINSDKYKLPFIADSIKNYTLVENGDIVFADASEDTKDIGKAVEFLNINDDSIVCGLHTIHARDTLNITIPGFKGYLFNSYSFHKQVRRLSQGTKIYSLNSSNFKEIFVNIPSKDEQSKITTFLSKIDDRITTQNKIIEDLEVLIKWIINQFFNRKSNSIIGNYIIQTSNRNSNLKITNVLSVSNKYGFIKQTEQFDDRVIASDDTRNYKIIEPNEFAYNPARINVGSIAKLSNNSTGIVSPMYICFKCNNNLLPDFLNYFFKSSVFNLELKRRLEGSVRQCLQFDGICDIPFYVPSIDEQLNFVKKVNLFFNKLQKEKDMLLLYKKQKSYLLQNMFI